MITLKELSGSGDQAQVLQRVAVDEQQIGQRALLDDAELPGVGVALARTWRAVALADVAMSSTSAGLNQRVILASWRPAAGNWHRTAYRCPRRA